MSGGQPELSPRVGARPTVYNYQKVFSFLRLNSGTAVAEHAILLALIMLGLVVAARAISYAAMNSPEKIASQALTDSQDAYGGPSSKIPAEHTKLESTWAAAYTLLPYFYIFELLAVLLLLYCFFAVRRERKIVQTYFVPRAEIKAASSEQLQVYLKRQEIYHSLSSNLNSLFNSQVQAQHLMSKRVTTVKPHIQVARMKQLLVEKQVRHLVVCDEAHRLIGIISDRDLHCDDSFTAEQVMTRDLITVPPDALISAVISLMLKEQISSIPIVQDGRVQGLLTTTDLIMAMQCSLQLWSKVADDSAAATHPTEPKNSQTTDPAELEELELISF